MLCTVDANVCVYVKCTIVADVYVVYNYREHVRSWALNKANVYCIQGVHMYIVYHVCGCVYNGMCVCVLCTNAAHASVDPQVVANISHKAGKKPAADRYLIGF